MLLKIKYYAVLIVLDLYHGEDEVSDVEVPAEAIGTHLNGEGWSYCCCVPYLPGQEEKSEDVALMAVVANRYSVLAFILVGVEWRTGVSNEIFVRVVEGLPDRVHGLGDDGVVWDTCFAMHVLRVGVLEVRHVVVGFH